MREIRARPETVSNSETYNNKERKNMGKIKLNNGMELNIIPDGIQEAGDYLTLYLAAEKTVEEYDGLFSVKENTEKISVIEELTGGVFKIHQGYIKLKECGKVYDVVVKQAEETPVTREAVKVVLFRPSDVEKRLEEVEKKVSNTDPQLQAAAMVVTRFQAQALPDVLALEAKVIYQTFDELVEKSYTAKEKGYKFCDGGDLYKTAQDNVTFQAQYRPGPGTESLYTRIDEAHAGTLEDPIPWKVNMQPELNKYYKEGELIAKCIEDPGQALHNKLSELCPGRYFEAV